MKLTTARAAGLRVLADGDAQQHPVYESNHTSLTAFVVYWQTVRWLLAEQLITTRLDRGRWLLELTDAGREASKAAAA